MPTNNTNGFSEEWWKRLEESLRGVGFAAFDAIIKQTITSLLGEDASKIESTNRIGGKFRRFTGGIMYRYEHDNGKKVMGIAPRGGVYELWTRSGQEFGPFGYPIGVPEVTGSKTKSTFEGGTITSTAAKPRTVMFYNTALIGVDVKTDHADWPAYTGRGRAAQRQAVARAVAESGADVVVLAELMVNQDRAELKKALKSIYPHSADGPDESDGVLGVEEEDGGLLVLSRHPIRKVRTTIFRSCCGVDCLANKGAVMVRVDPSDGPEFCVIGTHLQNGNSTSCPDPLGPGVGSGAKAKREAQLRHLDSWILGVRDLDLPVIIVGDFNINANTQTGREVLQKNLPEARDLWPEYQMWLPVNEDRKTGITSDKKSTYQVGTLSMKSKERGTEGTRLDLVLLDQGERVTAHIKKMRVVKPELSPDSGIDVSDHYAVEATFDMATVTHELNRKVRKTSARLKYIHALYLTAGGLAGVEVPWYSRQDSDEVDVSARIYKGTEPIVQPFPAAAPGDSFLPGGGISPFGGPGTDIRQKARVEYDPITMSMGERHEFSFNPGKTLIFDGADDIHMEITLKEIDTVAGVVVDQTAIGDDRDVIVPKSSQLLHAMHGRRYAPNVMHGDDSEYVAILMVNLKIEPFTHRHEQQLPPIDEIPI
ncbi:endonuclease/exonuclease/phosphatase family protein [Nocardia sp. NPDC003726]